MTGSDRPLRVAYTLEQCWHDVPGGTAVAALEVARLLNDRPDVEVVGVAGRHRSAPPEPFVPPVPVRQLSIARPWLYESWNRLERPAVERVTGPVDVVHSTTAIPAATRRPHVVTVHDLAFVEHPERFTKHGVRVMTRGLERCRSADLVLAPSRTTADALVAHGFDDARIRVVPWGVRAAAASPEDRDRVRRAFDLPDRFVLFVGTNEPRKNLARLAEATSAIGMPLVVAGPDGWGEAGPRPSGVAFLGFVAESDLGPLYELATVFAYPSLSEGFGLPVIEAMAHGVPVVTSAGGATEEVAGDAAVLVDPADTESIADGIEGAAADHATWAERARSRADEFTWEATVDATVDAYRSVAG